MVERVLSWSCTGMLVFGAAYFILEVIRIRREDAEQDRKYRERLQREHDESRH